ncbi:MAG: ribokinase [Acidobacteriota bacterium]
MSQKRIFVVGSANVDLVFALARLPREGETLTGGDLAVFPGGKGANQACAVARLGGSAAMVARVGEDAFGERLIASLRDAGADVTRVLRCARPTGCACIYVLPDGENSIVISPGANAALDPAGAVEGLADIREGDILLGQLETPLETVEAAFAHAKRRGALTILDPAPARPLPKALLVSIDIVTPNQTEAAILLDTPDAAIEADGDIVRAADRIVALGPRAAILKLGDRGSLYSNGKQRERAAAFRVKAIDTTAAGDVFNGALAVALAEGAAISDALRFASAAAAISVTRPGAQTSAPSRPEVEDMLAGAVSAPA